ncbi:hypothetical protein SAMN06265379_101208 [Saccharicrinis carchari]|uniref:Uncharacterized protein n=1 Tax=Saccharicrinis carchari TaxID=1168039 RepID=A0A521AKH2_SACCC|nr:hypothetical protein SAMN06265379_101208 [Saccharicrinis carchari]
MYGVDKKHCPAVIFSFNSLTNTLRFNALFAYQHFNTFRSL